MLPYYWLFDFHSYAVYLASLDDPELTNLALHEYKSATNMTDQFAALAALAQNPGQIRDEVLSDFYRKWQHDFLVRTSVEWKPFLGMKLFCYDFFFFFALCVCVCV